MENLVYLVKKPSEYADIINNFPAISANEKKRNVNTFRSLYETNHLPDYI